MPRVFSDPREKRAYTAWVEMRRRCRSMRRHCNRHYGPAGIRVCQRWEGSFASFLEDMGLPEKGQSLDRIRGRLGYEPGNCRWTTWLVQENNRSNNKPITHKGETLNQSQWCVKLGMKENTFLRRMKLGWSIRDVIERPVRVLKDPDPTKDRRFSSNRP